LTARFFVALLSLYAVLANVVEPACALATSEIPNNVVTDPRYLQFLKMHPCGMPDHSRATPAPDVPGDARQIESTYALTKTMRKNYVPTTNQFGRMAILVIAPNHDLPPIEAPLDVPTPAPSAIPSDLPSAMATAAASDTTAAPATDAPPTTTLESAAPTLPPTATATPSLIPIPAVPPGGGNGGRIIPPTPNAGANATPTPNPLPTDVPAVNASSPVYLVRPSGTPGPIPDKGASPAPNASPTRKPTTLPTLSPNDVVTIADHLSGSTDMSKPSDLTGNVHVFYTEGQIVGDRAHYDGDHTIVVSGHTYLINRAEDSILYGDQIAFDTRTRHATLINGSGESSEAVSTGKLHYAARTLDARSDGVSHGDHASFTTCENGHAGYHIEARTIDVTPGDKLIARKAVLYLGPTAILYIPFLVIPLVAAEIGQRTTSFIPLIGYDQLDGFFIKTRIGFGTSNQYYGYYRVEYFTKRGLGLGYVAYIGAKDAHRYTTIDSYTIKDHTLNERTTNVTIQDVETFSKRVRGQFGVSYIGNFGPGIDIPPTENITGSIVHVGNASTENLTFSRYLQGALSDDFTLGLTDSITLTPQLQQQFNFSYAKYLSPLTSADTFHIQSNTHYVTKLADYNLTYDKTDYSANPFGYDKLPELAILPHINYGTFKFGPQLQFTGGEYAEQQNHFSTSRFQGQLNESVFTKLFGDSDFSANYDLTQDYYGTGDEKAYDTQSAAITTPLGNHFVNSITYNEQHPIGPTDVPFQLFDHLSSGAHSAQDVLRFYNKDVYSLSLSDGTQFNRQAQGVTYQLNVRPSLKSYIVVGGYYQPGPGNGFSTTNVQTITPFGKDTTLEFSTNVDWKNHNRLEDKNIYLSKTVDMCYNILASYNQDLKQFSFSIVILAFPGQSAGFGFGGNQGASPILPQSFAF
jgi:hypothetical protein